MYSFSIYLASSISLDAYMDATIRAEEELKSANKEKDMLFTEALTRQKHRRDKLTTYGDGRYPMDFVEEMTVMRF